MRNRQRAERRVDRLVYYCSSVFERDGCPGGLARTRLVCGQGVGLSVFTRDERAGDTGARLDDGVAPVKVFVLHTVDADTKGLALFVGEDQANI